MDFKIKPCSETKHFGAFSFSMPLLVSQGQTFFKETRFLKLNFLLFLFFLLPSVISKFFLKCCPNCSQIGDTEPRFSSRYILVKTKPYATFFIFLTLFQHTILSIKAFGWFKKFLYGFYQLQKRN